MVALARTIQVTPELQLLGVLDAAQSQPVLLELDGIRYRLTKEPTQQVVEPSPLNELVAPRGESEPLVAYLERVGDAIMQGRRFEVDSTDLINEGREERTRELP